MIAPSIPRARMRELSGSDTALLERANALCKMLPHTPVIRLEHDRADIYAKLEFCNPIGSIKDRPALWMLRGAVSRGEIDRDTVVIESSSGNMAAALATFCRALGLRFIPVIDPNIAPGNEALLRATCDTVVRVEARDETGGFLKTRLTKVAELCRSIPNSFWTNQYGNPDAADAHYEITGGQIRRDFSTLDAVFIGVGSGGTVAGLSRRLKEDYPGVRIIAVDAEGSVAFGGPPRKRHISGIGSSIVPSFLRDAAIDDVIMVPELDAVRACRTLFDRHGIFAGGSSGSSFAAVESHLPRLPSHGRPTVLFLCADRGTAYLDTIYNPAWVAHTLAAPEP